MYIKAGAPAAAVRCAAEAGLWDQVIRAGNCTIGAGNTNAHILLAATALEKVNKYADAAKLYHKSGMFILYNTLLLLIFFKFTLAQVKCTMLLKLLLKVEMLELKY